MGDAPDKWDVLKARVTAEAEVFGNSVCKDRWDKGYYAAMDKVKEWFEDIENDECRKTRD